MKTDAADLTPEVQAHYDELRAQLAEHAHRYYVLDEPSIADAQYDVLYQSLEKLEAQFPQLMTMDSPTQRVGGSGVGHVSICRAWASHAEHSNRDRYHATRCRVF